MSCCTTPHAAPHAASTTQAPNPCPIDADLWLLAGQSNMVGAELVDVPGKTDSRIAMLNMDGHWMTAQEPVHRYYEADAPAYRAFSLSTVATEEQRKQMARDLDNVREASRKKAIGGYGPGLPFARHVLAHTGRPIGLIPCAQGATGMANWDPARKGEGTASHYGVILDRVRAVGGKIKGVLWYQGESDWSLADGYQAKLLGLIDALRNDTGIPDLPFIYVQIGRLVTTDPAPAAGWEKVRELQRQVAGMRPNVFVVPASDLPMTDHIHVSAAGQERLGKRLAEVALTHVYGKPGFGSPISLDSVSAANQPNQQATIRVRFKGVTGRLHAPGRPGFFEIRGATPTPIPTVVYRVDFDPQDPAVLNLRVAAPVSEGAQLVCGPGLDPYMNIVDDRDMAVPAFGPVPIPVEPTK